MTIQDLIDTLEKIKNKNKEIYLYQYDAWAEKDSFKSIHEVRKISGNYILY